MFNKYLQWSSDVGQGAFKKEFVSVGIPRINPETNQFYRIVISGQLSKKDAIMKSIYLSLLLVSGLGLNACIDLDLGGQFMYKQEYLKTDSGNAVGECTTQINPATDKLLFSPLPERSAKEYWEDNNLPKGTLYFICDGSTPLLPKDCQGNSLTTPQILRYWKKYDLPVGTTEFDCSSGVPKVPADS